MDLRNEDAAFPPVSVRTVAYGSNVRFLFNVPAAGSLGLGSDGAGKELVRIQDSEPSVHMFQRLCAVEGMVAGDVVRIALRTSLGIGTATFSVPEIVTVLFASPSDFTQALLPLHMLSFEAVGCVGDFGPTGADRQVVVTVTAGAAPFSRLDPRCTP